MNCLQSIERKKMEKKEIRFWSEISKDSKYESSKHPTEPITYIRKKKEKKK